MEGAPRLPRRLECTHLAARDRAPACADAVRSHIRRRKLVGRATAETAAAPATSPDAAGERALAALVDALPADRREAFVLTQLLGCSYDEAADVCGVPVGTIRSRVARARVDLVAAVRAAEATG